MKIALTGHRPEDCEDEEIVRDKVREALRAEKATTVINGLAAGFDLWGAAEARDLGLEIWSARPWKGHGPREADEELYNSVIRSSTLIFNVHEARKYPGAWVYHLRNQWMVDHADLVIGYWSGKRSGGTYACLNYAEEVKKDWINIYA
jgi:hypothetical protein